MLRRSRKVVGSALALLVFGAVAWPGSAMAAVAPQPRPDEWWFKSWGVQTHLWPMSTGKGVTIALIDTGVEASLPDFQGVVLPGMNAEGGAGDGRVDEDQFEKSRGHGTSMASLIAAQGRGTGLVGVAPDVKILPVVAQSHPAYVKALRFAADRGAQVISLSQGLPGSCPSAVQEAVAYALAKNAVVVAAAGNDGNGANSSTAPANCKGVLSVGAVDQNFQPWEKTQRQSYVKVAAPGVDTRVILKDGKLYRGSGTSAATALVSATVAIIRAKHPTMTNREVVRQLVASALDIYDKGKDDRTGYGIIRPYRPLAGKAPEGTANPVFEEFDRWMKTHHPEGDKSTSSTSAKGDESSSPNFFVYGGIVVAIVAVSVFGFFMFFLSRRKRPGAPAPMGTGPGVPPGFGQPPLGPPWGAQQPSGPPLGGQPQFPPPTPPGHRPPHGGVPGQPPH